MSEDPRCCGTGTCIITIEGVCWCGQVWDGEKMCMPKAMRSEVRDVDKKIVEIATDDSLHSRPTPHQLD